MSLTGVCNFTGVLANKDHTICIVQQLTKDYLTPTVIKKSLKIKYSELPFPSLVFGSLLISVTIFMFSEIRNSVINSIII